MFTTYLSTNLTYLRKTILALAKLTIDWNLNKANKLYIVIRSQH